MKKASFFVLLFASLAAVCLSIVCGSAKNERNPEFISVISPEQCVLCAKLNDTDENNLFLFDINTFSVEYVPILKYDPRGVRLDGPTATVTGWNIRTEGISGSGLIHSDRRLATGSVRFDKNYRIDSDLISMLYCQSCLDHMRDALYVPTEAYGIGIMNTNSKEVRLLEDSVTGFSMGDYYVQSVSRQDNEMYLTLFYAPAVE